MIVCTFDPVYCLQYALSLTKYWLYALVMLSIYAKLYSHLAVQKRESGCMHARNCVYLSKIENSSYYQEFVSHLMPVCWVFPKLSDYFSAERNAWKLNSYCGALLIFKESSFQLLVTKQLISTCTFPFQNLSSHYAVEYRVVQSCTCKEYSKNIQFMATSPFYNLTTYTTYKEHKILDCITSHNHKEDIYKSSSWW